MKTAGYLVAACGLGHTVGALVLTLPRYGRAWVDGALWVAPNSDHVGMTETAAAFWFSIQSFGVPLLLVGVMVLWMGRRDITPPTALAWTLVVWTLVGTAFSGISPLLLLLVAALLLFAARDPARSSGATDEAGTVRSERCDTGSPGAVGEHG